MKMSLHIMLCVCGRDGGGRVYSAVSMVTIPPFGWIIIVLTDVLYRSSIINCVCDVLTELESLRWMREVL